MNIKELNKILESILDSDNFKNWFGDSKVVDKEGNPLVCIHRTNADFDTFDIERSNLNNITGKGISFVTKASDNINMRAYGNKVIECYLKIENPFDLDKVYPKDFFKGWFSDEVLDYIWKTMKATQGKDDLTGMDFLMYLRYGIGKVVELKDVMNVYKKFQEHGYDGYVSDDKTMWTCFSSKQIKSVRNTTFSDSENINEKYEELKDGIYATTSAYDVLNQFKNKKKPLRVVYDSNNGYYFLGDALRYIHGELISAAYDNGFYYDEMKNNSRKEAMIYLGNNLETNDVLMLSFFPKGFGDIEDLDNERSSDWYTHKYIYDFGLVYVHEANDFTAFDLYNVLGNPVETEELELPESLNEQRAFHGSPYNFDKFDLSKFNRGDYGYGVYFTHSKGYATDYGDVKEYEIPDNEYLLDWDFNTQSDTVDDALYQIWKDTKDKDTEKKIEHAIYGTYSNTGGCIYYAISEVLGLSAKGTSEFLYKYGIKGTESFSGNCIAIFNPDDIKKLDTIKTVSEELERFI